MWYALEQGAKFTERVYFSEAEKPLIQGGLEKPMVVSVHWSNVSYFVEKTMLTIRKLS